MGIRLTYVIESNDFIYDIVVTYKWQPHNEHVPIMTLFADDAKYIKRLIHLLKNWHAGGAKNFHHGFEINERNNARVKRQDPRLNKINRSGTLLLL